MTIINNPCYFHWETHSCYGNRLHSFQLHLTCIQHACSDQLCATCSCVYNNIAFVDCTLVQMCVGVFVQVSQLEWLWAHTDLPHNTVCARVNYALPDYMHMHTERKHSRRCHNSGYYTQITQLRWLARSGRQHRLPCVRYFIKWMPASECAPPKASDFPLLEFITPKMSANCARRPQRRSPSVQTDQHTLGNERKPTKWIHFLNTKCNLGGCCSWHRIQRSNRLNIVWGYFMQAVEGPANNP